MLGSVLKKQMRSYFVVCMCRFEDIIELEVGWQVVEAAKRGRFVHSCRPCAVCWPPCSQKNHQHLC